MIVVYDKINDKNKESMKWHPYLFYEPVGTGNTYLATEIRVAACMSSMKVKFYRTAALVNELIDVDGAKLLNKITAGCYEKKSIILTTNLEFSK